MSVLRLATPVETARNDAITILEEVIEGCKKGDIAGIHIVCRFNDGTYATRGASFGNNHERAGRLLDLAIEELGYKAAGPED